MFIYGTSFAQNSDIVIISPHLFDEIKDSRFISANIKV